MFSTGRNLKSLLEKCNAGAFHPELCVATIGTTLYRPAEVVRAQR